MALTFAPVFTKASFHFFSEQFGEHPVFPVQLDQTTWDFAHLLGRRVVVDGVSYLCVGVERFDHRPPWKALETVALACAPWDPQQRQGVAA